MEYNKKLDDNSKFPFFIRPQNDPAVDKYNFVTT